MRWDDQRPLPPGTRHVVRLPGSRESAVAVDPEERSVDRTLVGFPGRGERAHEFDETLGKDSLAVPDPVVKIKIAEPSPIASASELVALSEEVAVRIGVHDHCANA